LTFPAKLQYQDNITIRKLLMMHMGDDAYQPCDDNSPFLQAKLSRGGTNGLNTVSTLKSMIEDEYIPKEYTATN
jgi:hypothetical protein